MTDLTFELVQQLGRNVSRIESWADKAEAFAKVKKFDADTLLQARLAPDMFPLAAQIGSACDNAKFLAARLSGKKPPVHADDQKTWAEVRIRVRSVSEYVAGFTAADFEGAAQRTASFAWLPGKMLEGQDYLVKYALPNFHFHVSMAYAILRHNGVDVGKTDFIGELPFKDA